MSSRPPSGFRYHHLSCLIPELQFTFPPTPGRRDAAPEIPEDQFKLWVQVQSTHNTPIEGFWLWLQEGEGHNIREVILSGAAKFDLNNPLHV